MLVFMLGMGGKNLFCDDVDTENIIGDDNFELTLNFFSHKVWLSLLVLAQYVAFGVSVHWIPGRSGASGDPVKHESQFKILTRRPNC